MKYAKLALGISLAILLVGCSKQANQSQNDIFKNAQEKYASLTSYSDEGQTMAAVNGMNLTTTFSIKLARPNMYRIEWAQKVHSNYTNTGVVWSAGDGDFMVMGNGNAQKQGSQESALSSATGVSGNAAATIPGTFFKMNWGNQLGKSVAGQKQQADEKVGGVDCYVFSNEPKQGMTRTLWIGKEDFLIHQLRTVTSAEALKKVLTEATKKHPEMMARLQQSGIQGITSTETHMNIVVNPMLTATDFCPLK
jgi:outer membrane lipoprotein-sorting protein